MKSNDYKVFITCKFSEAFFWFIFLPGRGRGKRSHNLKDISPCTPEGKMKWLNCMNKQNKIKISYSEGVHVEYDLNCTYKTYNCFYVYTCKPSSKGGYACSQDAHFLDYTGICCYPIC